MLLRSNTICGISDCSGKGGKYGLDLHHCHLKDENNLDNNCNCGKMTGQEIID